MEQRKLAIFDFDGTLFTKETIPFLVKQYGEQGFSRVRQGVVFIKVAMELFKYKMTKSYEKEEFRSQATQIFLELFKDMEKGEIKTFFENNVPGILNHLNPQVLKELEKAKMEGYETIILSGCFTDVLAKLTEELDMDTFIGTKLIFDESGKKIDYNVPLKIASGKNKTYFLKEYVKDKNIDWQNSRAYGDSSFDFGVLNMVGEPVCVNPDEGLLAIAKEKKWKIIRG